MARLEAADWGRRGEMQGYLQCVDALRELYDGELPREIRQFDIRFRLACSLQISFDSTFSYTKTESTRKTYRALMELNDLWFAYEGLFSLCKSNGIVKASGTKSDPFPEERIEDLGLNHIVHLLSAAYVDRLLSDPAKRSDVCGYIDYLLASATSQTQKGLLGRLKTKTQESECPTFSMWLALVYAIRNMYVHNTDTAKSGVKSYATKIGLLQISKDFMIGSMLAISEHVFRAETYQCQ
jgi:hypothetical protein